MNESGFIQVFNQRKLNFCNENLKKNLSFSIEIVNLNDLNELNNLSTSSVNFCSIPWHLKSYDDLLNLKNISALHYANQLMLINKQVILNFAVKNLTKGEVLKILNLVKWMGIKNLFALKGDENKLLKNRKNFQEEFPHAIDLVEFIKKHYEDYFTIGVAGYPDIHPDCKTLNEDVEFLKKKVRAGADYILTQATFNDKNLMNFLRKCKEVDINVPIVLGLFITNDHEHLIKISKLCNVKLSSEFLFATNSSPDISHNLIKRCSELIAQLLREKLQFNGVHLFSFNKFDLVKRFLKECESFQK